MEKSAKYIKATKTGSRQGKSLLDHLLHLSIAFVILTAFAGAAFIGVYEGLQTQIIEKVERHYFYPYPYQQAVNKYAKEYGVDSSLVAGVILAESKFVPTAHSNRGAVGLMQIMPETGEWIAQKVGDKSYTPEQLYNPELNIRFGTWYLSFLMNQFHHNEILAVTAYNAGHGQTEKWCEDYHWGHNFSNYSQIPFAETRHYVRKVIDNKMEYEKLYKAQ